MGGAEGDEARARQCVCGGHFVGRNDARVDRGCDEEGDAPVVISICVIRDGIVLVHKRAITVRVGKESRGGGDLKARDDPIARGEEQLGAIRKGRGEEELCRVKLDVGPILRDGGKRGPVVVGVHVDLECRVIVQIEDDGVQERVPIHLSKHDVDVGVGLGNGADLRWDSDEARGFAQVWVPVEGFRDHEDDVECGVIVDVDRGEGEGGAGGNGLVLDGDGRVDVKGEVCVSRDDLDTVLCVQNEDIQKSRSGVVCHAEDSLEDGGWGLLGRCLEGQAGCVPGNVLACDRRVRGGGEKGYVGDVCGSCCWLERGEKHGRGGEADAGEPALGQRAEEGPGLALLVGRGGGGECAGGGDGDGRVGGVFGVASGEGNGGHDGGDGGGDGIEPVGGGLTECLVPLGAGDKECDGGGRGEKVDRCRDVCDDGVWGSDEEDAIVVVVVPQPVRHGQGKGKLGRKLGHVKQEGKVDQGIIDAVDNHNVHVVSQADDGCCLLQRGGVDV